MTVPQYFMRMPDIIGNLRAKPPKAPIVPVCRSTWLAGVKSGIYPQPVKLSPRVVVWRSADVYALFNPTPGDAHRGGADHG